MKRMACWLLLLLLGACGGGGGGGGLTERELDELRSDPTTVRLSEIIDAADTLLMSDAHLGYTFTAGGFTDSANLVFRNDCQGSQCAADDGSDTTIGDLVDPAIETRLTEAALGMRGGFATLRTESRPRARQRSGRHLHLFPRGQRVWTLGRAWGMPRYRSRMAR